MSSSTEGNIPNNPQPEIVPNPQSPKLSQSSTEPPSSIHYKITPEEMWNCIKGSSQNWGIEGYQIYKKYYDYRQVKWLQQREKILKAHKKEWPPQNWPKDKESDKLVPPQKITFIDEQIKWANSFNDQKKSDEIKESLESVAANVGWVEVDATKLSGKILREPERKELSQDITESQIVEFYNRKL